MSSNSNNRDSDDNDLELMKQIAALAGKINRVKNSQAQSQGHYRQPSYASGRHPYSVNKSYSSPHYGSYNSGPYKRSKYNLTYVNPDATSSSNRATTPPATSLNNNTLPNGSKYVSDNERLAPTTTVSAPATPTITSPRAVNGTALSVSQHPSPTYIKTKSGSLVRVVDQPVITNAGVPQGRAKVNNKDILLNPRILPYCPQFTLTGKCTKGGRCPYARHDRAHLALCKQFLMRNGNCKRGNRCPLSHLPNDHNLPTCTYYLDGNCSCMYGKGHKDEETSTPSDNTKRRKRPIECKFAHPPKLAPDTRENTDRDLCKEFAYTGYCTLGSQRCPYVHSYQCPEFAEKGSCNVRNCNLMHVNDGYQDERKRIEEQKKNTKKEEKNGQSISSTELAKNLSLGDSDSDSDDEDQKRPNGFGQKKAGNDEETRDGSDNDVDEEEDLEFIEFWRNKSKQNPEEVEDDDEFSKNDDYIKF